ncbi:hypothetical protein [Pseudomonas oryzihabitans]|uniref:hypothetical protein n=1 Tax=Pseudomonas oryzihabitans TaxID=47885 RepID=UPI0011A5D044|nr:hypothetical protein [Pseudomonas psychrotolerans]
MLEYLKNQLAVTIKAYQNEDKDVPDELWEQGCLLFMAEQAAKERDEEKFLFALNELCGGDIATTFTA